MRGKTRPFLSFVGALALLAIAAAATGIPERGMAWLSSAPYSPDCDYILPLPGGSVPSPVMLMRIYKAAQESKKNPGAKIVISMKAEPPLAKSTLWKIREELIFRGVPKDKIILETKARSTDEHAKYIKEMKIGDPEKDKYLIVTSPSHTKRAVMAFEAAGFKRVYAAPAFPASGDEDLGDGTFFRYGFWSSLHTEIEVLRELAAIAYYKLTGRA